MTSRKILPLFCAILLAAGVFIYSYSSVIFQEGNPWPQIEGIARLELGSEEMVRLDSGENRYITKGDNFGIVESSMKNRGYDFAEQMGSGYIFVKGDTDKATVTHEYYSRFYSLWTVSETDSSRTIFSGTLVCLPVKDADMPHDDICLLGLLDEKGDYYRLENSDDNPVMFGAISIGAKISVEGDLVSGTNDVYQSSGTIAVTNVTKQDDIDSSDIEEGLRECMPKSDTASHERCNELLAMIRNFDDCAQAGFAIQKSDPPQCSTPDGRNFIDETNSSWESVLAALSGCEAESLFQNHGKLVTLELKNGNKLTAYEPRLDAIMEAVDDLDGRCGDIRLATE